jgi:fermentation-respiration switch protein FrsA (DUF1100 family)
MNLNIPLGPIPPADLLLIAGLVVILLSLTYLWIRRKRSKSYSAAPKDTMPKQKVTVWSFLIYIFRLVGFALVSFIIIGGGVLIYKDYQEITEEIRPAPSQVIIPDDLSLQIEEVVFIGGDNLSLSGWYIPPKNGVVIILLHGYGSNRSSMEWHARTLVDAGYGILMYDERGSGESEGKNRSYGWQDAPDVGGAISFLVGREEAFSPSIGILGCSIGGQIALQASSLYSEIEAVWADGASGIVASDQPSPDTWANSLAFLSNYVLDWMLSQRLDIQPPPPLKETIGKISPRPLMLVAGGFPRPYFGKESRRILYIAQFAHSNSEVWVIPEAVHCDGPSRVPEQYTQRLLDFFDRAFGL